MSSTLGRLRQRRNAESVHRLGARALDEMLEQIARETGERETVERIVAEFANIDLAALRFLGGDKFPPSTFALAGTGTCG